MWKETIICIIIVMVIILGNTWTINYTKESVEILSGKLQDLKQDLNQMQDKQEVEQKTKQKMEKIKEEWNKRHETLAYFIEHDELEKVEDNFVGIASFIETQEYAEAISELDKSDFILKHIEEKYAFKLENIF